MELIPTLEFGWLNGWILLCLLCLIEGFLLIVFPKDVVTRLFDRSGWDKKQRTFTVIGKLFSLACLILIILTPLKIVSSALVLGTILYILGLVGLIIAILNFRNTPLGQPVTGGLYRLSRHPQILMLFVLFMGICVALGSWLALLVLMISKLVQHLGILAEEEVCLERYGDSYRAYMKRVPRYFLF